MRLREAELRDIDDLLWMGRHFHKVSGYIEIEFDELSAKETLEKLIIQPQGILIVAENDGQLIGGIGALLYMLYFNSLHLAGQEFFWWLEPEYRGHSIGIEMLDEVEKQARQKGAKSFTMIALEELMPKALDKLYRKRGYRCLEHHYTKRL